LLDLSPDKIVVVATLAFLILGPGRIPGLARSLARARSQLHDLTKAIPTETLQMIRDPRKLLTDALPEDWAAARPRAAEADEAPSPVKPSPPQPDDVGFN
jgi:Sec-independent protein translocase protein TatA